MHVPVQMLPGSTPRSHTYLGPCSKQATDSEWLSPKHSLSEQCHASADQGHMPLCLLPPCSAVCAVGSSARGAAPPTRHHLLPIQVRDTHVLALETGICWGIYQALCIRSACIAIAALRSETSDVNSALDHNVLRTWPSRPAAGAVGIRGLAHACRERQRECSSTPVMARRANAAATFKQQPQPGLPLPHCATAAAAARGCVLYAPLS